MAQSYRMLVIDDDPGLRDYLEALAASRGYRVFTAANGEDALASLEQTRPDLVTLDLVLPGMDGLETLRQLQDRLPDVPVVMLSGHGQARNIVEAMKLGASDFLRKPFEVEELDVAFQKALEKRALRREVEDLRGRIRSESELLMLCGDDPKMRECRDIIEQVADTDITVLVRGESGTGKELVARALHRLSARADRPFVKVNCAALPSELLESELFGFEKGAFTGAQRRKLGKFEYANHGTIFLDEISEMHPSLQAKLLQVLQDGEFSRLGGENDVRVDTRVIAATNRNLETAVTDGSFREDLFYRLNVVTVLLPRCATGRTRSRCSSSISSTCTTASTARISNGCRRRRSRRFAPTSGPATSGSSRTWSKGWSCSATKRLCWRRLPTGWRLRRRRTRGIPPSISRRSAST
ncbi:MAG: sigma-54 dependent transcriptional regulator [Myxococcota bacterium]|nr:sigma-54 dependent transcriptional regulator [Myxococcota bacterium]